MEAFGMGMLAGYGIAIPVGAIAVLIVQAGVRCGFRCAFAAGAGAATADLLYAVLAVTGGVALTAAIAAVEQPLRLLSAGILAAIAVWGLARARRPASAAGVDEPVVVRGTYARFLGLTIVNPLTVVYFVTWVIGSGSTGGLTLAGAVAFVVGAFVASLSWQSLLAFVGSVLRRQLPARLHVGTAVAGNLVILGMAVAVVVR